MITYPNCKINLGLLVKAKRDDGFHELETVFYPVLLTDILEIIPSQANTSLNVTGILEDLNPLNNLVYKAYQLLQVNYNLPPVSMHLHKLIPAGAGLGGGSADAAFAITLLNDLFKLDISYHKQLDFARQLGSDCAFFIANKSVLAKGRGDVFSEIDLSLKGYSILLIKPQIHISTKEAYAGVIPKDDGRSLVHILNKPVSDWKNCLTNQFEDSIFPHYSLLKEIKELVYAQGALYASMSGSGSTIYGIFKEEIKFDSSLVPSDCFIWQGILT